MVSNKQALDTLAEVIVDQAIEINKLKKHIKAALYERRVFKRRWLELKQEQDHGKTK